MESYSVEAILSARDRGFTSAMQGALGATTSLASKVKSGIGFGFLMGAGQKAFNVISGAVGSLTGNLDAAISRFDTLNNFPKIMSNLGYSAKDASDALAILDEGVTGLPTSMDAIVGATQKIAPLTGSLQKASKVSLALNNALLAGGKSTEAQSNALEQYSQMLAAGKVDMQAWRSMLDAMPGQLDQLSKAILGNGKKQSDLYEAMKSGEVTFDDFNSALLRLNEEGIDGLASFEEQARTSTQGIGTAIQNLKTSFTKGKTKVIEAIDAMLKNNRLAGIAATLNKAKDKVNEFFGAIASKIKSIDDIAGKVKMLGAVAGSMGVTFAALTAAAPAIRILMSLGKAGSIAAIALSGLGAVIGGAGALAGLGALYITFRQEIDKVLKTATEKGPEIIAKLGEGIASRLPTLMSFGGQLVSKILEAVNANLPALAAAGLDILSAIGQGIATSAPAIIEAAAGIVGTLLEELGAAAPTLLTVGVTIVGALLSGIAAQLPALVESAYNALAYFVDSLSANLPTILEIGVQTVTNLVSGITEALPNITAGATQLMTSLFSAVIENLPTIITAGIQIITALAAGLIQAAPQILTSSAQMMASLIDTIMSTDWIAVGKDIISAIAGGIVNYGKTIWSSIKGVFTGSGGGEQATAESGKKSGASYTQSMAASINSTSGVLSGATSKAGAGAVKSFDTATANAGSGFSTTLSANLKGMEPVARTSGTNTGKGFATGIKSGQAPAASAAKTTVSKVDSIYRSGIGKARSTGSQISNGLASGIRAGEASVTASCNRMIAKINEVLRKKAEVHSPSRMTKRIGVRLAQGLGAGMKAGINGVKNAAVSTIKAMQDVMNKAAAKGTWSKDYAGAAATAIDKLKTKLSKKVSSLTKSFKNTINKKLESIRKKINKKSKGLKKALSKMGSTLSSKYSKALTNEMNDLVKKANKKLTALAEKYQEEYDSIVSSKDTFVDRMMDYGELFDKDKYGFVFFKDFAAETQKIKQITSMLQELQDWGVSRNFLDQITSMDTASQLATLNALLRKGKDDVVAYANSFDTYWKTAEKAGSTIYSPYVDALNKEFKTAANTILKELKKEFRDIGKSTAKGLAAGLKDKATVKAIKKAAGSAANAIISEIRKKLKIHSPSRVMEDIGLLSGEGLAEGLEEAKRIVAKTMDGLMEIPKAATPAYAGDIGLDEAYSYGAKLEGEIIVPVDLDGKQIAEVTAPFTESILNRRQTRANRKVGRL